MSLEFRIDRDSALLAHLPDETATLELGGRLARVLRPGLIVYLSGELGAGKTTLVRGCLRALGYQGRVSSPTFALVELYQVSNLYLHHFDFYRFRSPQEWADAGLRDAFSADYVCLVEWPERVGTQLPAADLRIELQTVGTGREVRIVAGTEKGKQCLDQLTE
jgi:tRNA threonylcarbamoyladenosine biosynthesis protein TsaE